MGEIRNVASISFIDEESDDEAWLFVRAHGERVLLGISFKENGDYEWSMGREDVTRLIAALQDASGERDARPR